MIWFRAFGTDDFLPFRFLFAHDIFQLVVGEKAEQLEQGEGLAADALEGSVRFGLGGLAEHFVNGIGMQAIETAGIRVGLVVETARRGIGDGESMEIEGAVRDQPGEAIEQIGTGSGGAEEIVIEAGIFPGEDGAALQISQGGVVDPVEQLLDGDALAVPARIAGLAFGEAVDLLGAGVPIGPPLQGDLTMVGLASAGGIERRSTDLEDAVGDRVEAGGFQVEDEDAAEGEGEVHGEGVQGLRD